MNVFDLIASLTLDTSDYERNLRDAEDQGESFGSIFGGIKTAAKAGIAGAVASIGAAVTAIGGLTKSAVTAYADFEQLTGGVETLFKDSAGTVEQYAREAYKNAGMTANEYMETVTSFSASLLQSTAQNAVTAVEQDTELIKKELDDQYDAAKSSYDKQYSEQKKYLSKQYDALKSSLDKQYDALRSSLDKQYDQRKKILDKEYDYVSDAADKEVEALEKALSQRERALEREQEAEIRAYEKATDAKLALIDKEYLESLKNIDQQKYERLKAIDEQINALNKQADAEEKASEAAEKATKQAEYEKAIRYAKTAEDRKLAEEKLNEYLLKLQKKENDDLRKEQIEVLKDQKEDIKEQASAQKEALKEQKDERVAAVKEESKAWLEATKEANQLEKEQLREQNKETLSEFKRAKKDELEALKESHSEQLSALKESQNNQLESVREANNTRLESVKESNDEELDALKQANAEKLKELKDYIKEEKELLKSTDGDMAGAIEQTSESRQKAAEIANMALQDMADNHNKMGTSMELIQNAYNGFARNSYVMLDNLKLGYQGTKEEMERLLSDAEAITGVHYDINNLSDVFTAIHVIQEELGITGTTAQEAEHTISGSIAMTKAAWGNLLTALADGNGDITDEIDDLMHSAGMAFENIMPVAQTAIEHIGEMIGQVLPVIIQGIPPFLEENVPIMAESVKAFFSTVFDAVKELDLVSKGTELLSKVAEGIRVGFPDFVTTALDTVGQFAEGLRSNVGQIVDAGLNLIVTLAQGIADALPDFFQKAPKIISDFAGLINDNLPKILTTGIEIIIILVKGLIQSIPTIIQNIPAIIKAIVDVFMAFNWLALGKSVITFIGDGIKALAEHLPGLLKNIGHTAVEWLKAINWRTLGQDVIDLIIIGIKALRDNIPKMLKSIGEKALSWFGKIDWLSLGENIVWGIIDGIGKATRYLLDTMGDLATNALGALMNFLGINSPSRLFRDKVGVSIPEGVAVGVNKHKGFVTDSIIELGQDAIDTAHEAFSGIGDEISDDLYESVNAGEDVYPLADEVTVTKYDDDTNTGSRYPSDNITINVYGYEGQDEKTIAEEVMKLFTLWNDQRERAFA